MDVMNLLTTIQSVTLISLEDFISGAVLLLSAKTTALDDLITKLETTQNTNKTNIELIDARQNLFRIFQKQVNQFINIQN